MVLETIAENWLAKNKEDASRWIATLSGIARDRALKAAANREGATRQESLSTALTINNEAIRIDAIETVIRNWASVDAKAAEAWLTASQLSKAEHDHLQDVIAATQQSAESEPANTGGH